MIRDRPGSLWSVGWQWLSYPTRKSTTGRNGFLLPDGPLEILASGTCFPDEPLALRFTPTDDLLSIPTSLEPTSNGDVVHLGKMSIFGLLLVFSYNQSGWTSSVLVGHTENPDGVPELQQQINPTPAKDLDIQDNWATRTAPRTTPPRYCETSSTAGWRKSEPICKFTQSLTAANSHRRYRGTRAREASFPLHAGNDQPDPES
jgi:hypothetical protein